MIDKVLKIQLIFLFLFSCKRNGNNNPLNIPQDNGCISRIEIPVHSPGSLSGSDFNLVKNLFINNGIDFQNLRFSRTYKDSILESNNKKVEYRSVYLIQYVNGHTTFVETLNLLFKNQIFSSRSGEYFNGTYLDTLPKLKLSQLRYLFLNALESDSFHENQLKDSCFKAEFGYYNLNMGTGRTDEKLVKAWQLTFKNRSFPVAYYKDDSGDLIFYSNGILTTQ